MLAAAPPGKIVIVERPDYIIVSLVPDKDARTWLERRMTWPAGGNVCTQTETVLLDNGVATLVPIGIHLPVGKFNSGREPNYAKVIVGKTVYKFHMHMVVMAHAITVWKVGPYVHL